jgi:hypothetical protein
MAADGGRRHEKKNGGELAHELEFQGAMKHVMAVLVFTSS